jgi:hypothetical protein
MDAEYPEDPTRPDIEFYRSQKKIILSLPVKADTESKE